VLIESVLAIREIRDLRTAVDLGCGPATCSGSGRAYGHGGLPTDEYWQFSSEIADSPICAGRSPIYLPPFFSGTGIKSAAAQFALVHRQERW
jgi:hypothetical protein